MTLIADSGALYALYDADDKHHVPILKTVRQEKGTIIIPTVILSEVDYLLREFLGVDAELDFLNAVNDGVYLLEPFTTADVIRCRELIAVYRDLDLGLADSAVIATAERLKVGRILTVDVRDFRAVKHARIEFKILPADA